MIFNRRPSTILNGLWECSYMGSVDLESIHPDDTRSWDKTWVPSAFDALPEHAGRRGAMLYRTTFTLEPGNRGRVTFGAVSLWCRVWVDGRLLKEHACGYAPFTVEIPVSVTPERSLVVLVDNRYDFDRVPMHEEYFDFYQYGGILRGVTVETLPGRGAYIDHVQTLVGEGWQEGRVSVRVWVHGANGTPVTLQSQIDSGQVSTHPDILVHDGIASLDLTVANPTPWSPESPALHTLRVSLDGSDTLEVRFGLRRIESRDGRLWLNGQPLQLRGFNRHEWHPNTGPCTPPLQMLADIQLLKDMGCNFVRGSHYPQDQQFLDLCDAMGLLVWEENLGWGQREPTFASSRWHVDHDESLQAMVRASANHPSIILWGFLNEAGSDSDYVKTAFEETVATLRDLDPSRLITYATMFALTDRYYHLVDLISLNVYPGWYGCEDVERPLDLIAPHMRECWNHVDASGFADKPVIISEIGAEGLYGWHDAHHDFFTEEYQAAYLETACREALGNPRCSGIALWHFSDIRTYGGGRSLKRPRAFNNKGVLDEYRRPKLAYTAVKKAFTEATL